MKILQITIITLTSFLLINSSLAAPEPEQKQPEKFCIETLNVYTPLYASHKRKRLTELTNYLSNNPSCEVVPLQELWTNKWAQFISRLVESHKTSFQFFSPLGTSVVKTGLALFSKHQVLSEQTTLFEENVDGFFDWAKKQFGISKAYSIYKMQTSSGLDYLLINTHLHPFSQAIRLSQILQLGKALDQSKYYELPVFIAGDFNFTAKSLEWDLLTNVFAFKDTMDGALYPCSYCNTNPHSWKTTSERIDYIFYRSSQSHKAVIQDSFINLKKLNNTYLSDHFSLLAQVQMVQAEHIYNDQRRDKAIVTLNHVIHKSDLSKIKTSLIYLKKLTKAFNNRDNQSTLTTW